MWNEILFEFCRRSKAKKQPKQTNNSKTSKGDLMKDSRRIGLFLVSLGVALSIGFFGLSFFELQAELSDKQALIDENQRIIDFQDQTKRDQSIFESGKKEGKAIAVYTINNDILTQIQKKRFVTFELTQDWNKPNDKIQVDFAIYNKTTNQCALPR